jgi:hypothetical protein
MEKNCTELIPPAQGFFNPETGRLMIGSKEICCAFNESDKRHSKTISLFLINVKIAEK